MIRTSISILFVFLPLPYKKFLLLLSLRSCHFVANDRILTKRRNILTDEDNGQ
jgi:hypothetical protein